MKIIVLLLATILLTHISSTGQQLPTIKQAVERDMADLEKQVAAGATSWRALMLLKIAQANSRPSALSYGVASFVCLKAGNETGAAEYLEKAVAMADDAEWRERLATYYGDRGRFDEAERHLGAAIRLQPGVKKYFALRCTIFISTKRAAEGVACFEEVTKKWVPGTADYLALGIGYGMLKRLDEAETALRQAIKLAPNVVEAHFMLVAIYASQEKFAAAIEAYRTGAKLDPKGKAQFDAALAKEGLSIEELEAELKRQESEREQNSTIDLSIVEDIVRLTERSPGWAELTKAEHQYLFGVITILRSAKEHYDRAERLERRSREGKSIGDRRPLGEILLEQEEMRKEAARIRRDGRELIVEMNKRHRELATQNPKSAARLSPYLRRAYSSKGFVLDESVFR